MSGVKIFILPIILMAMVLRVEGKQSPTLNTVVKVFRQADDVSREMWWVVAADRKPSQRSPFGKLTRSLQMDLGVKLPKSTGFRCDRYSLKRNLKSEARPYRVEVYESCFVKNPLFIAEWILEKDDKIEVWFHPENLTELLGLQASVINKKILCQLWFEKNATLSAMSCKDWSQDRNDKELVQLEVFEYKSKKNQIMEIKGVILEGMNPTKKIAAEVPMEGKILVKETEIPDPVIVQPKPVKQHSPKEGTLPEAEYIPGDQDDAAPKDDSLPQFDSPPPEADKGNYIR